MNERLYKTDEEKMKVAYEQALLAYKKQEVPVGSASFLNNKLISKNHNRVIQTNDPTGHSEILVIKETAEILGNYRLDNVEVYTTIEPCIMCYGALIHSRIKRLVYAAGNQKWGFIKYLKSNEDYMFNHKIKIHKGIMQKECKELIQKFFKIKRK